MVENKPKEDQNTKTIKKVDAKKVDTKKVDTKKVDTKKVDTKKVDTKKVDTKKVDTKKVDTKKVDAKKVDAKKVDAKKVDAKKVDAKTMAIFEFKGKQYIAREGEYVDVDIFDLENNETMDVEEVLYCTDGNKESFGAPYLSGAKVTLEFKDVVKADKLKFMKYKRRKNNARRIGHRATYARVVISKIKTA
jgi:ribosomal protein L21